jgi:hypothetical protein
MILVYKFIYCPMEQVPKLLDREKLHFYFCAVGSVKNEVTKVSLQQEPLSCNTRG